MYQNIEVFDVHPLVTSMLKKVTKTDDDSSMVRCLMMNRWMYLVDFVVKLGVVDIFAITTTMITRRPPFCRSRHFEKKHDVARF